VILAHVANEMASAEAGLMLREAWGSCEGTLVVVEPGTPAGFERVEALRRALLAAGAHPVAPCPHGATCPLAAAAEETRAALRRPPGRDAVPPGVIDWCHFVERVQRPEFQRRLKGAELGWEDAKFSFFAASRAPASDLPWARVLRHPVHGKGHVELDLCAREGRRRLVVGRRAATWKAARKLDWGDAIAEPPSLDDPPRGEP
jgi:ribosomal protein RSM22 (predicted rRNA methylase)